MKHVFTMIVMAVLVQPTLATAQVVQLPSIRQFSYSGSVLVPDQGSTYLGGNASSSIRSRSRGLPGFGPSPGSQFGQAQAASGASLSATIIDHNEIDRQILGESPQTMAWRARNRDVGSVEDQLDEIKSLVRNARSLHRSGRLSTSRSTYDLAIEKMHRLSQRPDAPRPTLVTMLAYADNEYNKFYGPLFPSPIPTPRAARTAAGSGMWP